MRRRPRPSIEALLIELIEQVACVGHSVDHLIRLVANSGGTDAAGIDAATKELRASSDALETATKNVGTETK